MSTLLILVRRDAKTEDEYNTWVRDVRTLIQGRWSCSCSSYEDTSTGLMGWFFTFYGFKVGAETARSALGLLVEHCVVCRGGEGSDPRELSEYGLALQKWQVPLIVTKKQDPEKDSPGEDSEEEMRSRKRKAGITYGGKAGSRGKN